MDTGGTEWDVKNVKTLLILGLTIRNVSTV